jgi:hypothetical protein
LAAPLHSLRHGNRPVCGLFSSIQAEDCIDRSVILWGQHSEMMMGARHPCRGADIQ